MLKFIFFTLKMSLIGVVSVFLANFITIDGSTISDHIRRIADRSKSAPVTRDVQRWAHQITTNPINKIEKFRDPAADEEVAPEDQIELKTILRKQSIKHRK
ncbi:MAG: hypothetical protein KA715_04570 [Xanthomonadaceae bacterium]|nr:hypothetical protein [Xanthomonadaceae bacterium]